MRLDRNPTEEAFRKSSELGCAFIMLGHGRFALVDLEDVGFLSNYVWHLQKRGYAARLQRVPWRTSCKIIYMHRAILGLQGGDRVECDHVNRDKIDNRRCNLRVCQRFQNNANRTKRNQKIEPTSKFKGVCFDRSKNLFLAQGRKHGKNHFLGRFRSELDAASAYNRWAGREFREFACVNEIL
jgi:hypothetical protein